MKHAFTMIELVFVIVIAGILSAMIASSFDGNNLRQAADQIVSHIRYTQHLAMMDNKFSSTDSQWFKQRWQIFFSTTANSTISYSILSDTKSALGNYQGSPKANNTYTQVTVAVNPINSMQYLIGTAYSTFNNSKTERLTDTLDIMKEYGIQDLDLSANCKIGTSARIAFDNIGRPLRGTSHNFTKSYKAGNFITSQCIIELCTVSDCTTATNDQKIKIAIEPETGYTHILLN